MDMRVAARGDFEPVPPETMQAAKAAIDAVAGPGDLVVHSPLFSVSELAFLGTLHASPALPTRELRTTRRIVVLDDADNPMHGFGRADLTRPIAGAGRGLVLRVFEPASDVAATLYDIVADLPRTTMRVERPAGTIVSRCTTTRAEGGLSCPGQPDWLYLATRQLVVSGKSATCVWAHPTTGGLIGFGLPQFPAPPPDRKLVLRLSAGLADDAVRGTPDGATVRTEVFQDGDKKGEVLVLNKVGWFDKVFELTPDAMVDLRVTTVRDGRRHHCIKARIEEAPR